MTTLTMSICLNDVLYSKLKNKGYIYPYTSAWLLEILPDTLQVNERSYYRELAIMNSGNEAIYYRSSENDLLCEFEAKKAVNAYAKCALYLFENGYMNLEIKERNTMQPAICAACTTGNHNTL